MVIRSNPIRPLFSLSFTVVNMLQNKKMAVFCDVAPCSLVETDRRLVGSCCFCHQSDRPGDGGRSPPTTWQSLGFLLRVNQVRFLPDTYPIIFYGHLPISFNGIETLKLRIN